jgi:hypothetical protein
MDDQTPPRAEPAASPDTTAVRPSGTSSSGTPWGTFALAAAGGAIVVLIALAIGVAAGILEMGTGRSAASQDLPAAQPTRPPSQADSSAGTIVLAAQTRGQLPVDPELPTAIDLSPTDVSWRGGDTVTIVGAEGANLRPYPVADDTVAAPSVGLAQGTEVQIVSTFRLRMGDGNWWYVRVPAGDSATTLAFGWIREDLIQPTGLE